MNANTLEQLTSHLKTSQLEISSLLEITAPDQDWCKDSDQWSFRYIAAHLATVEEDCFLDRVLRIASGENPNFKPYFNTGWDFSSIDLRESLHHWEVVRRQIIDFVHALDGEQLLCTGTHETYGKITVPDVLQVMLDHDNEHLQSLRQLMIEYSTQI